ncbi:MAG: cytochrome c [Bacteroidales bacterium]|nr:cytochrome c [Bacteroidales bacterium]
MRIIAKIILLLVISQGLNAQEWVVPADRKARLSPFEFSVQSRQAGETLFSANCMSCHGNPGRNNWLRDLNPQPGDPASEKYQGNSDGEIFHKVSEGRGVMPGFRNVLTQTDIWNLVAYIRSFNPSYRQVVAPKRTGDVPDFSYITLQVALAEPAGTVKVKATGYIDEKPLPVTGAVVQLSAQRMFGRLVLGEETTTDEAGMAIFSVPTNMKGDKTGNVSLRARLTEEDLYGIASADTLLQIGESVIPVSLTEERAMWNTVRKAPIWLIITFTLGVFSVWGFIFYVLLAIRDLWVIGGMEQDAGKIV